MAYCVAQDGTFVGKLFLPQLLEVDPHTKACLSVVTSDIVIPASSSIFQAIEIASDFVGEAMAVVDHKSGRMIGIITEADLFSFYLKAQSDAHKLEHG